MPAIYGDSVVPGSQSRDIGYSRCSWKTESVTETNECPPVPVPRLASTEPPTTVPFAQPPPVGRGHGQWVQTEER